MCCEARLGCDGSTNAYCLAASGLQEPDERV
jgi:hypothetical protein